MNTSSDKTNYSNKLIKELQLELLPRESGYISYIATSNRKLRKLGSGHSNYLKDCGLASKYD